MCQRRLIGVALHVQRQLLPRSRFQSYSQTGRIHTHLATVVRDTDELMLPVAARLEDHRAGFDRVDVDQRENHRVGGEFFHDAAGWLMMPLGLALLGVELWVLGKLLIERPSDEPAPEVILARVAVNPVALYQSGQPARREKPPTPEPTAPVEEVAAEEAVHA